MRTSNISEYVSGVILFHETVYQNDSKGTPLIKILTDQGMEIKRSLVGNYVTSLEMSGCSINVTVLDEEIINFWDAPVLTSSLRWKC